MRLASTLFLLCFICFNGLAWAAKYSIHIDNKLPIKIQVKAIDHQCVTRSEHFNREINAMGSMTPMLEAKGSQECFFKSTFITLQFIDPSNPDEIPSTVTIRAHHLEGQKEIHVHKINSKLFKIEHHIDHKINKLWLTLKEKYN